MRFAASTQRMMDEAETRGFTVLVGNDWRLWARDKWVGHRVYKIAQTNDKKRGFPLRTVWAVKARTAKPVGDQVPSWPNYWPKTAEGLQKLDEHLAKEQALA